MVGATITQGIQHLTELHSERWHPETSDQAWIPVFPGMTNYLRHPRQLSAGDSPLFSVIPAIS
jgi:hypothetical protein